MELKFSKYHGTGNDFILVDGIADKELNRELLEMHVENLCDRRFGIGADGLIIIVPHDDYDFEMIYYNSDGKQSSMCGNGGRCIVHFAFSKSYIGEECRFLAIDGPHLAKASMEEIALQMKDVQEIKQDGQAYVLDTGSPHYIYLEDIPGDEAFVKHAKEIRYGEKYGVAGINVNCVQVGADNTIAVLTYERGVEDITYSCGTGVVAAAIAHNNARGGTKDFETKIQTRGGTLFVQGVQNEKGYTDIWLKGPATPVFDGSISLQNAHPNFPKLH